MFYIATETLIWCIQLPTISLNPETTTDKRWNVSSNVTNIVFSIAIKLIPVAVLIGNTSDGRVIDSCGNSCHRPLTRERTNGTTN